MGRAHLIELRRQGRGVTVASVGGSECDRPRAPPLGILLRTAGQALRGGEIPPGPAYSEGEAESGDIPAERPGGNHVRHRTRQRLAPGLPRIRQPHGQCRGWLVVKVRGSEALPYTAGVICNKVAHDMATFVHGPQRSPIRCAASDPWLRPVRAHLWQAALDEIHARVSVVVERWGRRRWRR